MTSLKRMFCLADSDICNSSIPTAWTNFNQALLAVKTKTLKTFQRFDN